MKPIPYSQIKRILTTRYRTGGKLDTDAPGQTEVPKGVQPIKSVIQDARPDDALRVTKSPRTTTILVTPFMAEDPSNASKMNRYAIRATKDSLNKNEAPLASHLFFSEVLNVKNPIERDIGLHSQLMWMRSAKLVAVYSDFGITPAMQTVINAATQLSKKIEYRTIGATA